MEGETRSGDELIAEEVNSMAERLNDMEGGVSTVIEEELTPLDVKAEVNLRGDITGDIRLVLTTGGPYIEFNVSKKEVRGYWGGSDAWAPVTNYELCEELESYYWRQFEELVIA